MELSDDKDVLISLIDAVQVMANCRTMAALSLARCRQYFLAMKCFRGLCGLNTGFDSREPIMQVRSQDRQKPVQRWLADLR